MQTRAGRVLRAAGAAAAAARGARGTSEDGVVGPSAPPPAVHSSTGGHLQLTFLPVSASGLAL